jgi:hypothetical protein
MDQIKIMGLPWRLGGKMICGLMLMIESVGFPGGANDRWHGFSSGYAWVE